MDRRKTILTRSQTKLKRFFYSFILWGLLCALSLSSHAQVCTNKSRVYANFQDSKTVTSILGSSSITEAANAVDNDPSTSSKVTISTILGITSGTQFLEFTTNGTHASRRSIPANTPVTVKVTIPSSFLAVPGEVVVGSYTGLNTTSKTANQTQLFSQSTLGLLNGAGAIEITVTPAQVYEGVYVQLSAAVGLNTVLDVFGAYILEDNPSSVECDRAVDVLTGAAGSGLLSGLSGAANPYNAIDIGTNYLNTYSAISTGIQTINEAYLTAIFNQSAQPLDSIKIIYEAIGGLNLLSGFVIQPYLGSTPVGGAFTPINAVVTPVTGSTKTQIAFPVGQAFDRVKISWGGLISLGTELRIYNVTKAIPKPIPSIDGVTQSVKSICSGASPVLSISNFQNCTSYNWYADLSTNTPLYTGPVYQPGVLSVGEHVFYVESRRNNCLSSISERVKVTITVNPLPIVQATNVSICSGSRTVLSVDLPLSGINYNWYDAPAAGNLLGSGNTFTTPNLTANKTYYIEAVNATTFCTSANRAALQVQVNPLATIGATSGPNILCIGAAVTLSNSVAGGRWSSSDVAIATVNPTTGEVLAMAAGTAIISYTIDATSTTCSNTTGFNLAVSSPPGLSLGEMPEICEGLLVAQLNYTNPVNNPVSYSISWSSAALNPVSDQPLPAGSIPLSVPSTVAPGTYSGILVIKNNSNCSVQYNFNIKINSKPPAPHVLVQSSSQY